MTTAVIPDPETLPPVFPVQVASRVLGIGKNQTYDLIRRGAYPVRVLTINGHHKVSRYDLLAYLGHPDFAPSQPDIAGGAIARPVALGASGPG